MPARFLGWRASSAPGARNSPGSCLALTGREAGSVALGGQEVHFATSADAVGAGVFLVPEDRKGAGLLLDLSIAQNITLPNLRSYARRIVVSQHAELEQAERSRTDLDIRTSSVTQATSSLSGGNQQKVVLAKWLAMKPKVIIFDEPTRGIDVGAKAEIYHLMRGAVGLRRCRADDLVGHGRSDRRIGPRRGHA